MLKLRHLILFFIALPSFLIAQDCQLVIPVVESTIPALDEDGYIDLCLGDSILLNGAALFPENNTTYTQSIETSEFRWFSQDGQNTTGALTYFTPITSGGNRLYCQVIDIQGCDSTILVAELRISAPHEIEYITDLTEDLQCESDVVQTLEALPQSSISYSIPHIYGNINEVALPDGGGAAYYAPLFVYEEELDTLTSDIIEDMSICVTIEHSYARDIEVNIICPDGTSVILAEQLTSGGEVFLGEPFEDDEVGAPVSGVGYQYCWKADATNGTWVQFMNENNPQTLPTGDYNSAEDLNNLIGCPFSGEWVLVVRDWWGIDNGFIFGWSIEIGGTILEDEGSFDVNLTDSYWQNTGDNITDNTGNILSLIPQTSSEYIFTTEDDLGCTFNYAFQTDILDGENVECVPCENITVSAGEDILFTCNSTFVNLNAEDFLTGMTISYLWISEDGYYISDPSIPNPFVETPGEYILTMTRTDGCQVSDTVQIYATIEPVANIAMSEIDIICFDGSYTIDASGSSIGENIIYQWTLNGSNLAGENSLQIEAMTGGNYSLIVTDIVSQCSATASVEINIFDEIIEIVNVTSADCDESNGSIEVIPNGIPASFQWSTGEVTNEITDLSQGWYSLSITTEDCTTESNIYVDENVDCKAVISGRVYLSPNCIVNPAIEGIESIMLHLLPDDIYTYTDVNGYYEFITNEGVDFTINYIEEDQYNLVCPAIGSIDIPVANTGTISENNDFFVENASVNNLCVSAHSGPARPGFQQYIQLRVCNLGYEPASGTLLFTHDSLLLPTAAILDNADAYNEDTYLATFTIDNLLPSECIYVYPYLEVPTELTLGTLVNHSAEIIGTSVDFYPENNFASISDVITGSYDPNDKQNQTGANPFGSDIFLEDDVMQYQIRFQNTGTDTAFTVVIEDVLDEDLDVTTIRPGLSSHDYAVEFEGNNKLIFRFDNIMLPDSFINEPASNGFVSFTINTHENLPIGTLIENTAAIYFDYNEPVITNTVINTIVESTVRTQEAKMEDFGLFIQTNPVASELNYTFTLQERTELTVELYSSTAAFMQTLISDENMNEGVYQFSSSVVDNYLSGIYFLVLRTNKGMSIRKWVKL